LIVSRKTSGVEVGLGTGIALAAGGGLGGCVGFVRDVEVQPMIDKGKTTNKNK
jgi:hypothetical protein